MNTFDPVNTLAFALYSALATDLPAIPHERRGEKVFRRPGRSEVSVTLFMQVWSTTALGFDNTVAGQAFSSAYTVVVVCGRDACVYFGEKLAYTVDTRNREFMKDLARHDLKGQLEAQGFYKAALPQ